MVPPCKYSLSTKVVEENGPRGPMILWAGPGQQLRGNLFDEMDSQMNLLNFLENGEKGRFSE